MAGTAQSGELRRLETDTNGADDVALPSVRVIDAVAAADGEDPLDVAPLYDVVDPDALDQLVTSDLDGHVQFVYGDHDVTVHGDGRVVVDGTEHGGA